MEFHWDTSVRHAQTYVKKSVLNKLVPKLLKELGDEEFLIKSVIIKKILQH